MKTLRTILLTLITLLLCNGINAQTDWNKVMRERGEYYFSLEVQNTKEVQNIDALCSVDQLNGSTVICYANCKQYDEILRLGYQPTLLTPPSMQNEVVMWDGSNRAAYDWDQYPTYQAYEAMMQQFATDHPDRCTYFELGTLASGRKIMYCRLNNGHPEGKPKFLYTSTMHGDEVTGMMLMLRLIDELCTSDEQRIIDLLDNLDIYISPNTNPDGTYHGGNNNISGARRSNAHDVDLNRHFPDFVDGPHPDGASHYEDECTWMMEFAEENPFTMAANFHGGSEVMNFPWDNYRPHCADDAWWQLVCHEYADLTHEVNPNYMSDFDNGIIRGCDWYMIGGGRQDYMNYYRQCREVCIECSNAKMPSASQMPNFWNYNHNSMLTYMEECLNGIHGFITDADTGEPIVGASITIDNFDHHGSSVSSHDAGDYHRPIKGGTYSITYSAPGYLPQTLTVTAIDGQTTTQDVQLVSGGNLIPDFNASATEVALNGSVNFTDNTWGENIVHRAWTFEGGTPASSTDENPSNITYLTCGDFDVTLSVTNAEGETMTITKDDYIHVRESYNMQNGTITTCNAMFYDDNGPQGSYGNNKNYTMTFLPGNGNAVMQANFIEFSTEEGWDYLYIYDGASANATQIGRYSGDQNPGIITATNTEGALTFKFTSDQNTTSSGWAAALTCIFNNPLQVEATADPESINEGESTQLMAIATGGSGEYTYSWEPTESLDDATIANPTATPDEPTTYTVTVTDGISTTQAEIFIDIKDLSVNETGLMGINVYPNPAESVLNIEGHCDYRLLNCLGQTLAEGHCEGSARLFIKAFGEGVYFLNLSDGELNRIEKIVIQ